MRKFLIIILIGILLVALGFMAIQGLSIGNFRINSIKDIIGNNKKLDEELATLSYSIDNNYKTYKDSLDNSLRDLENKKQEYQDAITFSTEDEIQKANKSERYKIDYLWTKIGLYATKNGVELQMNATKNGVVLQMNTTNSGSDIPSIALYDISFTAIGEYLSISEFIYAIENDSNLGFKIEEFNLENYSENSLKGTFTVKNIPLDQSSIIEVQPTQSETYNMTDQGTNQTQPVTDQSANQTQSVTDQSASQPQTDSTGRQAQPETNE